MFLYANGHVCGGGTYAAQSSSDTVWDQHTRLTHRFGEEGERGKLRKDTGVSHVPRGQSSFYPKGCL